MLAVGNLSGAVSDSLCDLARNDTVVMSLNSGVDGFSTSSYQGMKQMVDMIKIK